MLAIAILAFMMAVGWGTMVQTARAKRHFEAVEDRYREVRVALARMVRDLSMAYISANEDRSLMEPRTFFVGESSGSVDTVSFTAFAHTPLYADANESDQTVISYFAGPSREDRGRTDLLRREARRTGNEKLESLPGETEVLFSGVVGLELAYWNVQNQEWQDTWSTQAQDGVAPHPPDRVRLKLTFLDDRGKETNVVTEVRIHVQETLQFYAN